MLSDLLTAFVLGLLTPLGAVCVLPLYPGFLVYLANKFTENITKKTYFLLGLIITLGVIIFMLLLGLVFTTLLQFSLTNIIGIISPIAFFILAIIGILLIFDVDFSKILPKPKTSLSPHPLRGAFFYGFFFGAIVIPCNPAFIAAFFTRAALITGFFQSMLSFLFFGLGIGFPLLLFSIISANWSSSIINWLTIHKRKINLISGLIMLAIAIYYLFFVFRVHSLVF